MSWRNFLLKEDLRISEIVDGALPNFYSRIILTHEDMKEYLDNNAELFRKEYYKTGLTEPSEEEIITEIVMIIIDMGYNLELEFETGQGKDPELSDYLRKIPIDIVNDVFGRLKNKFPEVNNIREDIIIYLIRIFIFGVLTAMFNETQQHVSKSWKGILKGGDNFAREKKSGLHGWFSRRGGKQKKGGKTQGGWIACGTCKDKGGPKPCGRTDASKGKKRRCRPTCAACKTYKRRKGTK